MPISATRISDGVGVGPGASRRRAAAGFTLLEILVVLTLLAVLTGTVVLGFTGADGRQRLAGEAERLAIRIELARQRALLRNREWGLHVDDDGYAFSEFDRASGEWVEHGRRPLRPVTLPPGMALELEAEDVGEVPFAETPERRLPSLLMSSSGEITPFRIYLEAEGAGLPHVVHSDGLTPVRAELLDDELAAAGGRRG